MEKLIALSQNDDREQWWPAVEQLGELASTDDAARIQVWARARVNTVGMKFVEVQPGSFQRSVFLIPSARTVVRSVEITKGYSIAVTEVTNAQFRKLVPEYRADAKYSPDPDSPAVSVMWKEAKRFCDLLSEREGVVYRLPTEAEWEYACRAGSTTGFCFGDDPSKLAQYGWHGYTNGRAVRVAVLRPNAWGIYDMHGNAMEWVADWYSFDNYIVETAEAGFVHRPKCLSGRSTHTLRGGGWPAHAWDCSSKARCPLPMFDRRPFSRDTVGFRQVVGFRLVRELGSAQQSGRPAEHSAS